MHQCNRRLSLSRSTLPDSPPQRCDDARATITPRKDSTSGHLVCLALHPAVKPTSATCLRPQTRLCRRKAVELVLGQSTVRTFRFSPRHQPVELPTTLNEVPPVIRQHYNRRTSYVLRPSKDGEAMLSRHQSPICGRESSNLE
jgi:hypothetical protein